jgi:hypothetical protein
LDQVTIFKFKNFLLSGEKNDVYCKLCGLEFLKTFKIKKTEIIEEKKPKKVNQREIISDYDISKSNSTNEFLVEAKKRKLNEESVTSFESILDSVFGM